MQIIYSYRNETRVCTRARGKKRLLGTMDNEYVYYLDYGDGFIEFTEVKIPCVRPSPQEADPTKGSDFKRAFGAGKPERKEVREMKEPRRTMTSPYRLRETGKQDEKEEGLGQENSSEKCQPG